MKICAQGLSFTLCLFISFGTNAREAINVAAANSTCPAITCSGNAFTERTGIAINYTCKSSGRLAKGISGRSLNADYYISANRRWMNYVVEKGLVDGSDVVSLWGNELVIAAPAKSKLEISLLSDLEKPEVQKILIGTPGTAPFGRYAKQALSNAGVWGKIKHKIETKMHITLLADTLKEEGEGVVGILFSTNLNAGIRNLYAIDNELHETIRYYSAVLSASKNREELVQFAAFLDGEQAKNCFSSKGFKVR